MSTRSIERSVSAGPLVLAIGVLAAAFAGMLTAVVGGAAGSKGIYYVAFFSLIVLGGIVTVTRKEPLRFAFLALILCFPLASALVPPARLGLTVFDCVMFTLTAGLLVKKALGAQEARAPLFPTASLAIAWLLTIPCALFSQFPVLSLEVLVIIFAKYAFFLYALDELRRKEGFERLVLLLSITTALIATGLFIDHFLHVNLSLRGSNLNQSSYSDGLAIWRAGGFFQDPQRAGAFLASTIAFLLLLAIRGRFDGMRMRFVVWIAIAAGFAGLVATISRSALLACTLVSGLALFTFNKWSPPVKLVLAACALLGLVLIALAPAEIWLDLLPRAVAQRFMHTQAEFETRLMIWLDTWRMFADHPVTGIGLGSFQSYLMETQPTVFNYYGIGTSAGVAYIPDQPENGYLKILYEGGIVGSISALVLVIDAVRRSIAVIRDEKTGPEARTEVISALAALVTFAVTFVTLFTISDERVFGLFALLLAVVWHRSTRRPAAQGLGK